MLNDIQPGLVRKNCRFCNVTFWAARKDQDFCKNAHRQAYYRWRKRLNTLTVQSSVLLAEIAEYMDYPVSKDTALANMVELRDKIKVLLRTRGISIKEIR